MRHGEPRVCSVRLAVVNRKATRTNQELSEAQRTRIVIDHHGVTSPSQGLEGSDTHGASDTIPDGRGDRREIR